MSLEQFAEVARTMTGSKLSTKLILLKAKSINKTTKEIICPKINQMVKEHNLPFDKAFPLIKDGFNQISNEYNIDSAVLFWVYMEWLNKQK